MERILPIAERVLRRAFARVLRQAAKIHHV
jgi:hypothetical protein